MNTTVNNAKIYAKRLLSEKLPKEYVFHNCTTLENIYNEAEEISQSIMLDDDEKEILFISILFSFAGYIDINQNYLEQSCSYAKKYLEKIDYPGSKTELVCEAILSLELDESPKNRIQQVLHDSYIFYYGKKSFFKVIELIKLEREFVLGKTIKQKTLLKEYLIKLDNHKYHTIYASKKYNKKKKKNIQKLHELLDTNKDAKIIEDNIVFNPFGRSVETMFRNNLRGHLELSTLADNKANIMLSINAIIISLILTIMVPNLVQYPGFIFPTIIIIITCVFAIVFATMATRPKITEGTFTREDILNKRTNLLFFGNFYNMKIDEFQWGMSEMMKDKDYLYSSMIKDFYYLGIVLNKKFFYLRICYNIFMYGFILSIISYLITVIVIHK